MNRDALAPLSKDDLIALVLAQADVIATGRIRGKSALQAIRDVIAGTPVAATA